ncbi:MAG: OsmC family protein [candidate division WOR-3 bacterium]
MSKIEIFPEFVEGLKGIEGFSQKKIKKGGWLAKKYGNLQPRIYEFESNLNFIAGKQFILYSSDKPDIISGCAPEFGGRKEFWSPQHLFVAAIELCLATTFLWLLEKENLIIAAYRSHAVGRAHLKNKDFVFSEILIKPIITICEKNIKEKILNLIQEAGQECMISKSIICPILIEPEIEISD